MGLLLQQRSQSRDSPPTESTLETVGISGKRASIKTGPQWTNKRKIKIKVCHPNAVINFQTA